MGANQGVTEKLGMEKQGWCFFYNVSNYQIFVVIEMPQGEINGGSRPPLSPQKRQVVFAPEGLREMHKNNLALIGGEIGGV